MSLGADIIFGLRQIKKRKVTSAAAILSLALAIGACTSALRLIDALLLRPLPIAAPERLYALSHQGIATPGNPSAYDGWEHSLFRQMRAAVASQATVIAISFAERVDLTYRAGPEMEKAHVQYVSGDMFGSFGLRPALGRLLAPNDDLKPGEHPVAVLSHDYWSRRFAGDPSVIGRTFRIGNNLYEIVGVGAQGFTGTEPGTMIDIFMPAAMHWGVTQPWSVFRVFVHVPSGVAAEQICDRLSGILQAANERRPKDQAQRLLMEPAVAGVSGLQRDYRVSLTAIAVLVSLVLLIAVANVANLMTAQAAARAREMALRVSLGASRARLVQLILLESTMLALFAAITGWLFAWWSAPFVLGRINPDNPARLSLSMDWRVAAFGLALTLGVALLFGLVPALRASVVMPAAALKGLESAHARNRWMGASVALQAAFCFQVLFVAGLFVATFDRLSNQPTGFSSERLLTIKIVTHKNEPSYLWDELVQHLRQMPGVESVAYSDWPLLDGYGYKVNSISLNGSPPTDAGAWFLNVSPGWIGVMKIPLLDGRDFRPGDLSPGAAIVNETFAKQYLDGGNPIGSWFEGTSGYMRGHRFQIVGLVRDSRYRYVRQDILPVAYTPFHRLDDKGTMLGGTLMIKTSGPNPLALASMLRHEVTRARPEFRVSNIRTEQELIESQTLRERLLAMLALFFAGVALLLACVGLYGVLDYSVLQRRREIGVRMAVGAQAAHIARLVTLDIFAMLMGGAVAGLALGIASARYLETLLFQVKATDAAMLAVPAVTILAAASLAALPAVIHAVRIDPARILAAE